MAAAAGAHLSDTPLILVGEMWGRLVEWERRHMLRPGFELANPGDMAIPRCASSAEEVLAIIQEHNARWKLAQGQTG